MDRGGVQADGIAIDWSFFKGAGPAVNEAVSNQQIDVAFKATLAVQLHSGRRAITNGRVVASGRMPDGIAVDALARTPTWVFHGGLDDKLPHAPWPPCAPLAAT